MNTTNPLIHTRRSFVGHLLDVTLTVIGWLIFCFLFATGILSVVHGEVVGPTALLGSTLLLSSTHTLLIYAILALVNASILMGWAFYNYRKFSGKDRRTPTAPLPSQHVQTSFDLSAAMLERARDARVMSISHEENSAICGIDIIEGPGPLPKRPLTPALTSHNIGTIASTTPLEGK